MEHELQAKFKFLTTGAVMYSVTLCGLEEVYRLFGVTSCLHNQN
jgi:hypothetical protein